MQPITNRKTKEPCRILRKEVTRTHTGSQTIWIIRDSRGLTTRWKTAAATKVFSGLPNWSKQLRRPKKELRSFTCPSPSDEMADVEKHLAEVPSCQPWLDNNPAAKASLELGLQQASQGRGRYLGSFAQFAGSSASQRRL